MNHTRTSCRSRRYCAMPIRLTGHATREHDLPNSTVWLLRQGRLCSHSWRRCEFRIIPNKCHCSSMQRDVGGSDFMSRRDRPTWSVRHRWVASWKCRRSSRHTGKFLRLLGLHWNHVSKVYTRRTGVHKGANSACSPRISQCWHSGDETNSL